MQFLNMPETNDKEFVNMELVFKIIYYEIKPQGETKIIFYKDESNYYTTNNFKDLKEAKKWFKTTGTKLRRK